MCTDLLFIREIVCFATTMKLPCTSVFESVSRYFNPFVLMLRKETFKQFFKYIG